jgi:hypothetical protein
MSEKKEGRYLELRGFGFGVPLEFFSISRDKKSA